MDHGFFIRPMLFGMCDVPRNWKFVVKMTPFCFVFVYINCTGKKSSSTVPQKSAFLQSNQLNSFEPFLPMVQEDNGMMLRLVWSQFNTSCIFHCNSFLYRLQKSILDCSKICTGVFTHCSSGFSSHKVHPFQAKCLLINFTSSFLPYILQQPSSLQLKYFHLQPLRFQCKLVPFCPYHHQSTIHLPHLISSSLFITADSPSLILLLTAPWYISQINLTAVSFKDIFHFTENTRAVVATPWWLAYLTSTVCCYGINICMSEKNSYVVL